MRAKGRDWQPVGPALIHAAQPAKTALFAGGNGGDVRKTLAHLGRRRLFPMN
jgi:hypothetical protein